MASSTTQVIAVRVPNHQAERIRRIAREDEATVNDVMRDVLNRALPTEVEEFLEFLDELDPTGWEDDRGLFLVRDTARSYTDSDSVAELREHIATYFRYLFSENVITYTDAGESSESAAREAAADCVDCIASLDHFVAEFRAALAGLALLES